MVEKPVEWITCRKCNLEWSKPSINRWGYCPVCNRVKLVERNPESKLSSCDILQLVLNDFWNESGQEEYLKWNGQLNELPEKYKNRLYDSLNIKQDVLNV